MAILKDGESVPFTFKVPKDWKDRYRELKKRAKSHGKKLSAQEDLRHFLKNYLDTVEKEIKKLDESDEKKEGE